MQIYNLFCYHQTTKGYFCGVFGNSIAMYEYDLLNVLRTIITNRSPLLKCVKRKLHRHNGIVYIVPVIDKAGDMYLVNWYAVHCVKLRKDFIAMFVLCVLSNCPMLGSVEGVEAWNLAYYDLVGQLSGIR